MHLLTYAIPIFWELTMCKVLWHALHVNKDKKYGAQSLPISTTEMLSISKRKSTEECHVKIREKDNICLKHIKVYMRGHLMKVGYGEHKGLSK